MAGSIPVAFPAPGTESYAAHRRKGGRLVDSDKVIIDTYLLPKSHGTCRRFCCECCLIVGCMLPLLGPLLGLCVFVPYFDLLFEEGNVIQSDTPCFGDEPTICPVSFQFDYFFWNITNAEQWLNGTQPPQFQELGPYTYDVYEYRYNVEFSDTYASISYTNHNFQTFSQADSCTSCTLQDVFVGINRAYLAVVKSNGGQESDLLLPSVVLTLNAIYGGVLAAVQQEYGQSPAEVQASLAVEQWVHCDVLPVITGQELCAGQHPYSNASISLQSGILLLQAFLGNASAADAEGSDPAARAAVNTFVLGPPKAQAAQYNLTTAQVWAVQQYLEGLVRTFVAPAFQENVLGPLGGPLSGGLVVTRTVGDWIDGWADPILAAAFGADSLASHVRLAFAWPNATSPMDIFQKNASQLSHKDDLLIFERNITTGKTAGQDVPEQALSHGGYSVVKVLRTAPAPDQAIMADNRSIAVNGADGGLAFGPTLDKRKLQTVFDATFYRPINTTFSGDWVDVKGISAMLYGLAPEALASCSASSLADPAQRCIYPDTLNGTWNVSLTYDSDTLITLPHFLEADDILQTSTGFAFDPNEGQHGYKFGVDPTTGVTVYGSKGFQFVHLVRPTDIFYPDLWTNLDAGLGAAWIPSYWVRSRFEPADAVAATFRFALMLQALMRTMWVHAVPILGGVMIIIAVWFLFLSKNAKLEHAEMKVRRKSRAREPKLSSDELDDLTQQAADEGGGSSSRRPWTLPAAEPSRKSQLNFSAKETPGGMPSGSLSFPVLPILGRQGSQVPLLPLNQIMPEPEDPETEDFNADEQQAEELPCKSLGLVGWGGNLRAMRTPSEEAAHLDHSLFRPALLSQPGSRQVDEGGSTLESMILQRRSTTASSWGVMTDTSESRSAIRTSHLSQGSSSSSSGKASRGQSRKFSTLELGTIIEEARSVTATPRRRANKSISWADLKYLTDTSDGEHNAKRNVESQCLLSATESQEQTQRDTNGRTDAHGQGASKGQDETA